MGSFMAEDHPSKLLEHGRMISSPTRVVGFSVKETWNDELLERAYAADLEGAMLELEDGDDMTKEELEEKNRHTLKLFLDQAKREIMQFTFEVERQLQNGGSFIFPGLGVMKMGKKRQEVTFEKDIHCDLSPQEFGLEPLSVKPLATPSRLVEPAAPPKIKKVAPEKEGRWSEPQVKRSEPPVKRDEPQRKKSTPKRFSWVRFCLWVLVVVVALLVLVYIFRDALRPWLELILYSPEEREILRLL